MISKTKFVIRSLLCNDFTGGILLAFFKKSIPDIRWHGFKFFLTGVQTSRANIAAIFWGFYEAAEIRLIHKYFDGNTDIVELGGSLGVVSAHIMSKLHPGKKLITVEANPYLIKNMQLNIERFKKKDTEFKILNCAIQYSGEHARFHISPDTTESSVDRPGEKNPGITVPATTLMEIVKNEKLDNFSLVCDIEGSEIEVISLDSEALKRCRDLFIELHEVEYNNICYTPDDMLAKLIEDHGFKLHSRQGTVFYLTK